MQNIEHEKKKKSFVEKVRIIVIGDSLISYHLKLDSFHYQLYIKIPKFEQPAIKMSQSIHQQQKKGEFNYKEIKNKVI